MVSWRCKKGIQTCGNLVWALPACGLFVLAGCLSRPFTEGQTKEIAVGSARSPQGAVDLVTFYGYVSTESDPLLCV